MYGVIVYKLGLLWKKKVLVIVSMYSQKFYDMQL